MAMTLVQLSNFIRVVELKSLSKAAAIVRVAQPTLSRQVRALEVEVGSPLLVRHAWGVSPTAAGEALMIHAIRLLREADAIVDTVRAVAAEPTGRVGLGVPTSLAQPLLPPLSAAVRRRFPAVRLQLTDGFSATLHRRTLSGDLDLAILYQDRLIGPLSSSPLLRENLVLVSAASCDFPGSTPELTLATAPLVLPQRPNRLRLIVEESLAQISGVIPVIEVDSLVAILAMVEQGQGVTVLPYATVADRVLQGILKVADLASPQLSRTLLLARPGEYHPTAASAAVESEIRALVKDLALRMKWTPLF
jgi:LysR family transcriptional regulator, nitrogen assimilation regulatory protein